MDQNSKCKNYLQAHDKNNAPLVNQERHKGLLHHRNRMATCLPNQMNIPASDTQRRQQQGSRHRPCRSLHPSALEGDPHWKWSQQHQRVAHRHHIVRTRMRKTTLAKTSENDASFAMAILSSPRCSTTKTLLTSCSGVENKCLYARD